MNLVKDSRPDHVYYPVGLPFLQCEPNYEKGQLLQLQRNATNKGHVPLHASVPCPKLYFEKEKPVERYETGTSCLLPFEHRKNDHTRSASRS